MNHDEFCPLKFAIVSIFVEQTFCHSVTRNLRNQYFARRAHLIQKFEESASHHRWKSAEIHFRSTLNNRYPWISLVACNFSRWIIRCSKLSILHFFIFGPPDRGFPADGVMALGEIGTPGWTYCDIDLDAIKEVRTGGVVLNRTHWSEQDMRDLSVPVATVSNESSWKFSKIDTCSARRDVLRTTLR